MNTATETDVYVLNHGDGTTHWKLDPPLDGHDHILVCDRSWMTGIREIRLEGLDLPDWINGPGVINVVPNLIEVFPADADGNVVTDEMDTIATPVSLRRPADGADVTQVLRSLGYTRA